MPRLSLDGRTLDVPPDALASWATSTIVGPLEFAGMVHWAHHFAMPAGAIAEPMRVIDHALDRLRENAPVVDPPMRDVVTAVLPALDAIARTSTEILVWRDTHLPHLVTAKHEDESSRAGPRQPPWSENPQFRRLFGKLTSALAGYLAVLEQAIPVIRAIPTSIDSHLAEQLDTAISQIAEYPMLIQNGYTQTGS